MGEPIRVLHILQRMEAGGTQALLMNIYRKIDRTKVQFDFLVVYKEKQFYDDEIELAKKNKHIHWNDIKTDIENKKQIQFILIHFSMKYSNKEIKDFLDGQKMSNLFYII